ERSPRTSSRRRAVLRSFDSLRGSFHWFEKQLIGSGEQPMGSSLGDAVLQTPLLRGVGVDRDRPLQERFELRAILGLDADVFGVRHIRGGETAAGELDRTLEVSVRACDRIVLRSRAAQLVGDEK